MEKKPRNKQLFKKDLDDELLCLIKEIYSIKNLDNHTFTKKDLININITSRLESIKDILKEYYLKCKAEKYLENFTDRRSITILKQILKDFDYRVVSKEKYANGKKFINYKILKNNSLSIENLKMKFD